MTDHLPIPPDPLYPPLIIPCLSNISYDGFEFENYPFRRGWDVNMLKAGFFNQYPPEKTAAFLQDWLYFGLIYQVINAQKSDYVTQDPACRYGRVTTKNLRQDVLAQLYRLSDRLEYGSGQQHIVDRARKWLREAEASIMTLNFFCRLTSSSEQKGVEDLWPISPEIDLSFRVLGVTLSAMCSSLTILLGSTDFNLRGLEFRGSPLAESRMRLAKWCPSEIVRASKEFSSASMHYISTLRRAEAGRDHGQCTSTKCEAFFTDPATYQTQHVYQGCKCSDVVPDIASIIAIIRSGDIPLLTIKIDERGTPSLVVEAYKSGMEYVAISHVWADGLGNSKHKSLPRCQINRLKNILDELRDSKSQLSMLNSFRVEALVRRLRNICVRFWCDTICVPLQSVDANARKTSIKTMSHIYKNAYQVLVLDKELMGTSHVTILDTFMRCSLSGWMRRLWTLQEAVLGDRLFVKFKDRIIDIQQCYEKLQASPHQQDLQSEAELLDRFYGSPFTDCQQFYYGMRGMRETLHAPEERKLTRLMKPQYGESPEALVATECRGVMAAFQASRYRTTSRKEDIFVCLGNLLGYDEDLSRVPLGHRVRTILERKDTLPHGLLFVPGPRTRYAGWRWAVSDFDAEGQSLMTGDIDDTRPARIGVNGLAVYYPGLLLPQAIQPDSPDDFAMAVCVDGSGRSRAWWRFSLLPVDTSTAEVSDSTPPVSVDRDFENQRYCMIYDDKGRKMRANVHLAAALVSVGISDISQILDVRNQLVCGFVRLAIAQYIGGDDELAILQRRRDVDIKLCKEGFALPVLRSWTIE